ncbi:MAG: hypothetical protein RR341_08470, partial [Bacteroidales bacterium]
SLGGVTTGLNVGVQLPVIGSGGISDAPADGGTYARKNAAWSVLSDVATSGAYDDLTGVPAITGKADKVVISNETATEKEIRPNVLYIWGEVSALTIMLTPPDDGGAVNEYMFQFKSDAPATTLILPATVVFSTAVNIKANKTYQVSIVNNLGVIAEF